MEDSGIHLKEKKDEKDLSLHPLMIFEISIGSMNEGMRFIPLPNINPLG
jgi:hypothetical protein